MTKEETKKEISKELEGIERLLFEQRISVLNKENWPVKLDIQTLSHIEAEIKQIIRRTKKLLIQSNEKRVKPKPLKYHCCISGKGFGIKNYPFYLTKAIAQ